MKINITIEIDDAELNEYLGIPKKDESKADKSKLSNFARIFDEGSVAWTKDSEYNLQFLKGVEQLCNDTLRIRGYVFLNEVYDKLGIPRSKAGQVVGWSDNLYADDNQISFGIYDIPRNADSINGYDNKFILDFNVDGEILSKI